MTDILNKVDVYKRQVKVGVMITTDKCYDNREQLNGYVETDPFGGRCV